MSELELSEDLLSALVDGELDDAARVAVESRLASSEEWQAVLTEVTETRAAIRGLGPVEAPAGFWERVLAEAPSDDAVVDLAARRRERRRSDVRPSPRIVRVRDASRTRRVAMLAGVAAAAAFVVGVAAVPSTSSDRVRPPVAAFSDAHSTRSSVGEDAISTLAPVAVSSFGR